MTSTLGRIEKPALIAAIIGPIQSVSGWMIAGSLWPGYDPVRLTISDLAAPESPVKVIMSSFFVFGGLLTLLVAFYAKTFSTTGRVVIFISALCTFGLTIFPTPLEGSSTTHRIFAISSFVLSAGWQLFAMRTRKDAHWIIRPVASISFTIFQAILATSFLFVWADKTATDVGVWERAVATSQVLQMSVVLLVLYLSQRRSQTA